MFKKLAHGLRVLPAFISSAALASSLPAGSKVHFATCTLPGVEKGCVVASSGGATFNVTGAKPGIKPYQWLQGTGTVVSKMSFCMQGQIVQDFVPDKEQALVGCVSLRNKRLK